MIGGVAALGLLMLGPASAAATQVQERPFKVSLTSEFSIQGECDPGVPRQVITGSGHATHLGQFTIEGSVCLTPTPQPGIVTWTAANGDEIVITFFALVGDVGPDGSAPIRLVALSETGSGRFAQVDLQGGDPEGTVWFGETPGTGYLEAEGIGMISYDASDRSG